MQVKEEDEYDPEVEAMVNKMQISAPFNYRVRFNMFLKPLKHSKRA